MCACVACAVNHDARGCRHCGGAVCDRCGVYVDGRWEHPGDCPTENDEGERMKDEFGPGEADILHSPFAIQHSPGVRP